MSEVIARRMAILRLARARGSVRLRDVRQALPYWAGETLRLDLAYWVSRGELRPQGERKGRYYVAREPEASCHLMG